MFKRILVPLDGSRLAESVLPVAAYLAEKLGATLLLFHAIEQAAPDTVHGDHHLSDPTEAQAYLNQLAVRVAHGPVIVEKHVHSVGQPDVAKSIIEHCVEHQIDLVVLCAHGGSGWRERIVGNIAQQVIARGTTPVLLARPIENPRDLAFYKILVPLDGTPHHEPALPIATEIARACGAALRLVNVVPTTSTLSAERAGTGALLPTTMAAVLELAQRNAVVYLQGVIQKLSSAGLPVTAEVARGEIAPAILDAARRTSADLIVIATHGRTTIGAFWSGSVTPKIVGQSAVPVLLVRVQGEESAR